MLGALKVEEDADHLNTPNKIEHALNLEENWCVLYCIHYMTEAMPIVTYINSLSVQQDITLR